MTNQEVLLALAEELRQGEAELQQALLLMGDTQMPQECVHIAKQSYCEFTTRVAGVADAIDLGSLQTLMSFIDTNMSALVEGSPALRNDAKILDLLQRWPAVLAAFIQEPGDTQKATALIELLQHACWPWKVDAKQFETIIADIRAYADEGVGVSQEPELSADDVRIEIPQDISPKLLQTFQQELPQSTAELSRRIQSLSGGQAGLDEIGEARRVAHTLKGAANIVGVPGIANITHYLEDIFESLAKYKALPKDALAAVLLEAGDCLEMMAEAALGVAEAPTQGLQVLQQLLEWKNRLVAEGADILKPLPADNKPDGATASSLQAAPKITTPRRGTYVFDKLLDMAGELSSTNLLMQGRLQQVFKHAEALQKQHQALRTGMSALQELIFNSDLQKHLSGVGRHHMQAAFDPLEMDQYHELHSLANVFTELLDDVGDVNKSVNTQLNEIKELLNLQDQLNRELGESITAERLAPVKSIVPRLQRSVRQTCRMVEKQAELHIEGEELAIDSAILEGMVDALLHILRNAVDHGVEAPEQRQRLGKPIVANIALRFARLGNNIVIRCRDDGRGIDTAAVKSKALQLGLIQAEQIVDEKTLFELILQPGFSTKQDASQVSGRGVGMDVVAKHVADLRGSLTIRSEAQRGTEFIIALPQTLLKTHVVLLRSGDYMYGIASASFNQIVSLPADVWQAEEGARTIEFNHQQYDVRYLSELLGIKRNSEGHSLGKRQVAILVQDEHQKCAALIDEAVGNGELVVKKVGRYMPRMNGIIGTIITAEGSAAPVYDMKELLRKPSRIISDFLQQQAAQPITGALNVLIVDDSSSARRSLSQVATDAGYDVRTAIDGVEAISLIEEKCPDLILTDLEMPKMNGLELVAHLRAAEQTKNLPVVMVTSRSTEKHRSQALSAGVDRYITKPFTNDDLMEEIHHLLSNKSLHMLPELAEVSPSVG